MFTMVSNLLCSLTVCHMLESLDVDLVDKDDHAAVMKSPRIPS